MKCFTYLRLSPVIAFLVLSLSLVPLSSCQSAVSTSDKVPTATDYDAVSCAPGQFKVLSHEGIQCEDPEEESDTFSHFVVDSAQRDNDALLALSCGEHQIRTLNVHTHQTECMDSHDFDISDEPLIGYEEDAFYKPHRLQDNWGYSEDDVDSIKNHYQNQLDMLEDENATLRNKLRDAEVARDSYYNLALEATTGWMKSLSVNPSTQFQSNCIATPINGKLPLNGFCVLTQSQ